jgi:hypothetical protein|tara:strand:+ start:7170 stop:7787 length:618 start_codon:yes stop_codon:yes gene_type:complete
MNSEQQLRQIIKEELMALLSEDVVTYDDQMTAIEKMLFQIKDANASGNTKEADQLISVLMPQIMSMGFDKAHLSKISRGVRNMMTDKDVYLIMSTYKLMGEGSDHEQEIKDDIYKYKIIVSVPFATSKNKDEKVNQLKYELVTAGVKILGIKQLPIAELAKAGDESVIQLHMLMLLQTYKKRSELENRLQPNYKLIKIKDVTEDE